MLITKLTYVHSKILNKGKLIVRTGKTDKESIYFYKNKLINT